VRLEALWNALQDTHPFVLLCGYPMQRLTGDGFAALVGEVCAEHGRVIPSESYAVLGSEEDRRRAVAALQQQAAERNRAEREREELLVREREARRAAEEALRLREEFLSIAAHELRTPLTSLNGYAQMAARQLEREGRLEQPRAERMLGAIAGQAERLSRLVAKLLDVSRLEGGSLTLERRPVDLVGLAAGCVDAAQACTDRHRVTLQAPSTLEAEADPLRLEQVLTNLLDNAIKYSPEGGPIQVVLARARDGWVELAVRDWGLGIPPRRRGRIFERFYQAHGDGHRSGLGLGLYVSRRIAELHGGAIRAEFPHDGGTRFVVSLPVAAESPRGALSVG
jgi:signal transduction histidine kinase